jgi:hypothetical protein
MTEQEKQAIRELARSMPPYYSESKAIFSLLTALDERDQEIQDTYADYKEKDLQLRLEKAKNERLRGYLEQIATDAEKYGDFHYANIANAGLEDN